MHRIRHCTALAGLVRALCQAFTSSTIASVTLEIRLAIVGFGLGPLVQRGDLFSTNWFGGLVFAPLAIILGLIVIAFALFKPKWLAAKRAEPKHKRKH